MCYDLKDERDWLPRPYGPLDLEPADRPWSIGHRQRLAWGAPSASPARCHFLRRYGLCRNGHLVIRVKVEDAAFRSVLILRC
jgi:hypothetical protein